MRTAMRIYKCRCGQFTPVDTSSPAPLCSGCGSRDFTHVLWFQPAGSQAKPGWVQSPCQSDGGTPLTSSSDFEPNAAHVPTRHTDDVQDSNLNISRARALLVMERDSKAMRGDGPTVFAQVKNDVGTEEIVKHVLSAWREA